MRSGARDWAGGGASVLPPDSGCPEPIIEMNGTGAQGRRCRDFATTLKAAPFAGVDQARILRPAVAALQPRVDDPQDAERRHPDRGPLDLTRLHGPEGHEEAEDEQDPERRDPEQITR